MQLINLNSTRTITYLLPLITYLLSLITFIYELFINILPTNPTIFNFSFNFNNFNNFNSKIFSNSLNEFDSIL
jgi:hypothetical protein